MHLLGAPNYPNYTMHVLDPSTCVIQPLILISRFWFKHLLTHFNYHCTTIHTSSIVVFVEIYTLHQYIEALTFIVYD